jgi:hypothetical protein
MKKKRDDPILMPDMDLKQVIGLDFEYSIDRQSKSQEEQRMG